jgi:molecular chaperone GrpE
VGYNVNEPQQEPQTEEALELNDAVPETDALETAQKEIAELKDKYLRAVAEMQNIQKRAQRDVEDASKYGVISSAKPFLSVADNLARALEAAPADLPDAARLVLDGIRATQRELQSALERMGVVPVVAEPGQNLNPHEHEVMFEVSSDQPNGTIVQVLEKGYKIHDRLLRPARISVAKNTVMPDDKTLDVEA